MSKKSLPGIAFWNVPSPNCQIMEAAPMVRSWKLIVTGAQPVAGAAVNCAIGAGCTSTVVVAVSLQPKEELAIRTGWNKVSAKPLCEYRCAGFVEALPPPSPKVQR